MRDMYQRYIAYIVACNKIGQKAQKVSKQLNVERMNIIFGGDDSPHLRPPLHYFGLVPGQHGDEYRIDPNHYDAIRLLDYYTLDDVLDVWDILPWGLKLAVLHVFI